MLANTWQKNWQYIQITINDQLHAEIKIKYEKFDQKLRKLKDTQKIVPKENTFYPRVINKTNITFTDYELNLLGKGLKYNIWHKPKNWITTLALEAETGICSIHIQDQDYFWGQVAKTINCLYQQEKNIHYNNKRKANNENRIIKTIRTKLKENNAIITKAGKGNSIIIVIQKDYTDKIDKFISSSQFDVLKSDPTNTYQKQIRNTLNSCKAIIHNEMKPRLINLNPKSPNMIGLIKVHKQENPIRPIVNWTNAPAYKTVKHFTTALNKAISLPYAFNIMNSMQLINDLK